MSGANPQLSIGQMAAEIWARRRFVFIATLTVGLITAVITLFLTPMYRATVLLAPPEKGSEQGGLAALAGQFSGLADLAGMNLSGSANVDQSIALMTSRQFTDQFILDEHVREVMYPDLWDPATQNWRKTERGPSVVSWIEGKLGNAAPATTATTDGGPTLWKTSKYFNRLRTITQDKKTSLVTLTMEWRDPQTAAKWANDMVQRLNQHARDRAVADANRSLEYLNGELVKNHVMEMQQTIDRLIEREMRANVAAHVNEEYAFRVLDPAVPPEERAYPKRALTTLAAMFATGFAASLWIVFGPAPRRKERDS